MKLALILIGLALVVSSGFAQEQKPAVMNASQLNQMAERFVSGPGVGATTAKMQDFRSKTTAEIVGKKLSLELTVEDVIGNGDNSFSARFSDTSKASKTLVLVKTLDTKVLDLKVSDRVVVTGSVSEVHNIFRPGGGLGAGKLSINISMTDCGFTVLARAPVVAQAVAQPEEIFGVSAPASVELVRPSTADKPTPLFNVNFQGLSLSSACAQLSAASGMTITSTNCGRRALTLVLKGKSMGDICLSIATQLHIKMEPVGKTGFRFSSEKNQYKGR